MRAIKAKALRQQASIKASKYKLHAQTFYQDKQHKPRKLYSGRINPDGTQHYHIITPVTRSLGQCQRKLYQDLKKV